MIDVNLNRWGADEPPKWKPRPFRAGRRSALGICMSPAWVSILTLLVGIHREFATKPCKSVRKPKTVSEGY